MARKPAQIVGQPVPGYYLLSRVPKGWGVPCQIIETDGRFSAVVDGEPLLGAWTADEIRDFWADFLFAKATHPMVQLQAHGMPCDRATYDQRIAMKVWARTHNPDHPCLHPMRPMVTFLLVPTEF